MSRITSLGGKFPPKDQMADFHYHLIEEMEKHWGRLDQHRPYFFKNIRSAREIRSIVENANDLAEAKRKLCEFLTGVLRSGDRKFIDKVLYDYENPYCRALCAWVQDFAVENERAAAGKLFKGVPGSIAPVYTLFLYRLGRLETERGLDMRTVLEQAERIIKEAAEEGSVKKISDCPEQYFDLDTWSIVTANESSDSEWKVQQIAMLIRHIYEHDSKRRVVDSFDPSWAKISENPQGQEDQISDLIRSLFSMTARFHDLDPEQRPALGRGRGRMYLMWEDWWSHYQAQYKEVERLKMAEERLLTNVFTGMSVDEIASLRPDFELIDSKWMGQPDIGNILKKFFFFWGDHGLYDVKDSYGAIEAIARNKIVQDQELKKRAGLTGPNSPSSVYSTVSLQIDWEGNSASLNCDGSTAAELCVKAAKSIGLRVKRKQEKIIVKGRFWRHNMADLGIKIREEGASTSSLTVRNESLHFGPGFSGLAKEFLAALERVVDLNQSETVLD